jgi:hypothetical protein
MAADKKWRAQFSRCGPLARVLVTFAVALSTAPLPAVAQTHATEFQVKAAYLYNFGKFVRRPAESNPGTDPFEICVLGKDPFQSILEATVTGESIDGKSIAVKRLAGVAEASACNILFISSSEEPRLKSILAATQQLSILTVSDIPHFAERGGVIGFVWKEGKIRFEVNLGAAELSHLAFSSELLKVASRVIGKAAPQA